MWNPVPTAKLLPASLEPEYHPSVFSSSFRECFCFADCVHLNSTYLPAYVPCPLLDSWRQCCLSFFEGFSTLCATAQQPLIIYHIYSSSSQASFDDKPERIKSSNISVHVMTINASLSVGCDHQKEWSEGHKYSTVMSYYRQKAADKYLATFLFFLGQLFPVSPLKPYPFTFYQWQFSIKNEKVSNTSEYVPLFKVWESWAYTFDKRNYRILQCVRHPC